jgi:uncharacterized membrane protein (DUF373 family)
MRIHASHTDVHRMARRFLEPAQDILVLGIGLALFGLMVRTLMSLFKQILGPSLDFRVVVAEVLFMLVMVEVMRLLILYLEEHRVEDRAELAADRGAEPLLRRPRCAAPFRRPARARFAAFPGTG